MRMNNAAYHITSLHRIVMCPSVCPSVRPSQAGSTIQDGGRTVMCHREIARRLDFQNGGRRRHVNAC